MRVVFTLFYNIQYLTIADPRGKVVLPKGLAPGDITVPSTNGAKPTRNL